MERRTAQDTILVVDDEIWIRNTLQRILSREGYRCLLADSVESAFQVLDREDVSLVLSDICMPGGETGLALIPHLRDRHPRAAIVLVTAVDEESTAREALRQGAAGYLLKPFPVGSLLAHVDAALRGRPALAAI